MAARPSPASKQLQFKLVLLGESAVGKSSIVLRFVKDAFDDYRESTIGAAFLTQTVQLEEATVKFEIWDTAGQERYKSLAPMYYRHAHCALVVYDITSSASLEKAKAWIRELQRQADANIVIALAGNKADLAPERRQVSEEEARALVQDEEWGVGIWREVSAKTGEGIQELFREIAKKMPIQQAQARSTQGAAGGAAGARRAGVDLNQGDKGVLDGCAC